MGITLAERFRRILPDLASIGSSNPNFFNCLLIILFTLFAVGKPGGAFFLTNSRPASDRRLAELKFLAVYENILAAFAVGLPVFR